MKMLTQTKLSFYQESINYVAMRGYIVNARNTMIFCFDPPDVIANFTLVGGNSLYL